jgi:predicted  nucleic acid-binding Zn-ribbon protein
LDKQELLYELRLKQNQLNGLLEEKATLEEKLETLDAFSKECNEHIASFEGSMSRRRQRLNGVNSLFSSVKSALLYTQRVNAALSGQDYANTVSSISSLQDSISEQRRMITADLLQAESEISRLRNTISQLEYEYERFPEEVECNVQ